MKKVTKKLSLPAASYVMLGDEGFIIFNNKKKEMSTKFSVIFVNV